MKKFFIIFSPFFILGFIICNSYFNIKDIGEFKNSCFNSNDSLNKTVMVIVPHEDDEINLAGGILKNYTENGYNVKVVFTTNGDFNYSGKTRILEGINACKVMGIPEKNVFFLGFGDFLNDNKYTHIYHAPNDYRMSSYAGYNTTYGLKEHPTYSNLKQGKELEYTRSNLLFSLINILLEFKPKEIFCVDFDSHPDHRATSLLFEEAMGIILKDNINYTPEIYKGYAYSTAWTAEYDFYDINLISTLNPDNSTKKKSEIGITQYDWNERVRFPVHRETLTRLLFDNLIMKSLSEHKLPKARINAGRIINSDKVFWHRSTNSYTYKSKITASSGNTKYLNDFKLFDCNDIVNLDDYFYTNYLWTPLNNDTEKKIKVVFDSPKNISTINLYDNPDQNSNIVSGTLIFSDGSTLKTGPLCKKGSKTNINFYQKNNITSFTFQIDSFVGIHPGLTEIEANGKFTSERQIIKLFDKSNDSFIYRYFVKENTSELELGVYQYPQKNDYTIRILGNHNNHVYLKNSKLIISDQFKYCMIRVEEKNNPTVYDEIELVKINKIDLYVYNLLGKFEFLCTNIYLESFKLYYRCISFIKKRF